MNKLILFAVLAATAALTVVPAFALDTGLGYGTYTALGTKDIREGVMDIVALLLGLLGILVIVGIIAGGFIRMTSAGNEEKVSMGNKIIIAGIIGLAIIFLSYAIAAFVIGQLITSTGAA